MEMAPSPETPLVNQSYQLDKYPDKNWWIYVVLPDIMPDRHAVFSWVKVKGAIDGFQISNIHLMPLPDGTLYFPVKYEICKAIGKNVGDQVHIILFADQTPTEIPEELLYALNESPTAYLSFQSLTDSLRFGIIDWIYSAKTKEIIAERIAKTVDRLVKLTIKQRT